MTVHFHSISIFDDFCIFLLLHSVHFFLFVRVADEAKTMESNTLRPYEYYFCSNSFQSDLHALQFRSKNFVISLLSFRLTDVAQSNATALHAAIWEYGNLVRTD